MASKYLKRFQVPNNFENILSDFAKEILRNQPKDIIDFGIEYFKGLENNVKLDYKDKGENRPENYKRPENQEPNIINAPNNLEISQEDKNRLQRSMDKIERINKEPEHIQEKEKKEEKIEDKNRFEKEEKEERHEEYTEQIIEKKEHHSEENVQVTKQVTVVTKETVIRNGEVIKDEEKVEHYDDNNNVPKIDRFKEFEEEEKMKKDEPQVLRKTEENQQQSEERYQDVDRQVDEENKKESGDLLSKHSQDNEIIQKEEPPQEAPEGEVQRNEIDQNIGLNNNSEGSVVVNKSNEVRPPEEEQREEKHGDNYGDWFIKHCKGTIIENKPFEEKYDLFERYQGDYQTWFDNHSKLSNK